VAAGDVVLPARGPRLTTPRAHDPWSLPPLGLYQWRVYTEGRDSQVILSANFQVPIYSGLSVPHKIHIVASIWLVPVDDAPPMNFPSKIWQATYLDSIISPFL
jgi:hypothetical protein